MEKKKTTNNKVKPEPEKEDKKFYKLATDTRPDLKTWSCPPLNGRPPHFRSPKELAEKIAKYFDVGCIRPKTVYSMGQSIVTEKRIPTIAGLAVFCGFAGRESFYSQGKRGEEFLHIVNWAKSVMESFHEENIASGEACTGSIWWTKCHAGWKDQSLEIADKTEALEFELVTE